MKSPAMTPLGVATPHSEAFGPTEELPMQRQPPTPVCKAFTLCKQIFYDEMTQEHTLVAPLHQIFASEFPAVFDVSAFARLSNAHGPYRVELQLRTLEGE